MTEEQLQEIEAGAAAATPGPWRVGTSDKGSVFCPFALAPEGPNGERNLLRLNPNFRVMEDVAFIAHARTDVPALVAEVRQQRVELDGLKIAMREMTEVIRRAHAVLVGGQ